MLGRTIRLVGVLATSIGLVPIAAGVVLTGLAPAFAQSDEVQNTVNLINDLRQRLVRAIDDGRFQDAEPLARQGLAEAEKLFGTENILLAPKISDLANVLSQLGRLEEAEPLYRRALALREGALPSDDPDIVASLFELSNTLRGLNRLDEAERLLRRALVIAEAIMPEDSISFARLLDNLADNLARTARPEEAERLLRRALAIYERQGPAADTLVGATLHNIAISLRSQGRYEESERMYRRALALNEKVLPKGHPNLARNLVGLAGVVGPLGKLDEAETLTRQALAILEATLPENHPDIAMNLQGLGMVLIRLGRIDEAERVHRRALGIFEAGLPKDHPMIGDHLEELAFLRGTYQSDHEEALALLDRAAKIHTAPQNRATLTTQDWRKVAMLRVGNATALGERTGNPVADELISARRAAFVDLQWERFGGAGSAIAAASARAQADPDVSELARERDRLLSEIKRLDDAFIAASSAPEDGAKNQLGDLRRKADEARQQLATLDEEISRRFPAFAELIEAVPLAVADLQPLLQPDEVLLSITPYYPQGLFYAFDRERGYFTRLDESADLPVLAARLRCSAAGGLDPACRSGATDTAPETETAPVNRGAVAMKAKSPADGVFDLDLAHDLYRRLFREDVPGFIRGKKLIIVPSPELMNLPWHLLLTEPPPVGWNAPSADRAKAYREAKWMFRNHASITVLPMVSSLRALRSGTPAQRTADRAFLGVGDPIIGANEAELAAPPLDCDEPAPTLVASVDLTARSAAGGPAELFVGARDQQGFALADPELVRRQPRLADTRCELVSVAHALEDAGERADLLLGPDASETQLRDLDESTALSRYRILHFATHGLLGGQLGLGEHGLVLTPPQQATARDDGILTASEVSTLTLSADWVVLSACNTAASSPGQAEALSGLARAFFYAGAKSLLVSSWPVYSDAAVKITTRAFDAMSKEPQLGRAEALTIAMTDTLSEADSEFTAHPSYWAPFFLVGEGSR